MEESILEFGIKRENEERRDGGFAIVFDPNTKKYACYKYPKSETLCFFGGGFNDNENEIDGSLRELTEESGFYDFLLVEKLGNCFVHYFNRNKQVNRSAMVTSILVVLNSSDKNNQSLEDHESDFELVFSEKDTILKSMLLNNQEKDYDHWIYFLEKADKRLKELGHL